MNLYVVRYNTQPQLGGHHCSTECACTSVEVIDAENAVVGYVTNKVADWLVKNGTAMDITPTWERLEDRT
jgi:hypothetical protein